jgi:hypothetical protein
MDILQWWQIKWGPTQLLSGLSLGWGIIFLRQAQCPLQPQRVRSSSQN